MSWFQHSVFLTGESVQYAKIWAPQTDSVIVNGSSVSFIQNGNYVEFKVTSVHDKGDLASGVINDFQLEQNYPNPFNSSTSIRFFLQKRNFVILRIYNISGQLITTLIHREMESGDHTVNWNGIDNYKQSLPSGIYFYRLEIGNKTMTKRMLLWSSK